MAAANQTKDDAPKVASAKVVKYVGTGDIAEIDKASWGNVLTESEMADEKVKKVVFNKANKWTVPADEFTDAQMRYFDEDDDRYVVADIEVPKA